MSLTLEGISLKLSGRNIVDNVSLKVHTGEVVGLLGPNGAGKTTTFNLVIGLIRPDCGRLLIDNSSVLHLPMSGRAKMGIGYLPQEPSVFRNLTVRQNLEIALSSNNFSSLLAKEILERLINDFNLEHFLDRFGFQLSGGERRRCEIARALAVGKGGPKYLLLDEPFAGVDPIAVCDIQNLIQKLKNLGKGILITDHSVRETLKITERSYILNEGKILASGSSLQVASDPLVKQHYLGEDFQL